MDEEREHLPRIEDPTVYCRSGNVDTTEDDLRRSGLMALRLID